MLAALPLVALVLAGCAAPPESTTEPVAGPLEPPASAAEGAEASRPAEPASPAAAPPAPAGPSPAAGEAAPRGNASVSAEAGAPQPGPGDAAATEDGSAPSPAPEGAGNASAPQASGQAGDPTPGAEAPLPALFKGERWVYRGVNATGRNYTEAREVLGEGELRGVATYLLASRVGDVNETLHVTRDGLNPVNDTGFETELLRFPLAVGANWTFSWEQSHEVQNQTGRAGTVRQWLRANVSVLALEDVEVPAGTFETYHVRANLTVSLGHLARWLVLDYWYAPEAKALARLESLNQAGQRTWAELVDFEVLRA